VNDLIFIFFGKNEVDTVIKCGGMCGRLTNKASKLQKLKITLKTST
jgi:hypothetical protein